MFGSGATHAWPQASLPGAGWTHYDPTNRINAGFHLIPVAIARHPGQAAPLAGSWFGGAQDYLCMSVNVAVHKLCDVSDPSGAQEMVRFHGHRGSPEALETALKRWKERQWNSVAFGIQSYLE